MASSDSVEQHKASTVALSSKLLTIPTQPSVDHCNKGLLSLLFPTRAAFFNHKDSTMLKHVVKSIHEHEDSDKEMDVETFQVKFKFCSRIRNSKSFAVALATKQL